jgi:hypothetical protein
VERWKRSLARDGRGWGAMLPHAGAGRAAVWDE